MNNIALVVTDNTTVVAYIKEGGDEVGSSMCPPVDKPDLVCQETGNSQSSTHPRPAECDGRQTIQTRIVPFQWHQPQMDLFATRFNNKLPQFASLVPETPRPGWGMHSVCPRKIWTHMSSHQQPSWAKWWRSCRTTHATGSY